MTYLDYIGNLVGQRTELLSQGSHRALQGSAKASGPPSFPTETRHRQSYCLDVCLWSLFIHIQ